MVYQLCFAILQVRVAETDTKYSKVASIIFCTKKGGAKNPYKSFTIKIRANPHKSVQSLSQNLITPYN
jgi:hypothetical protein